MSFGGADETMSLNIEVHGAEKVRDLTESLGKQSEAFKKAEGATKAATKGTADLGRTVMEGSRILQDFAQGGLGGVLNNLEGFARAAGLGAGAAGAATALGVAVWALGPPLKELFKALSEGSHAIPEAADALGRLNGALKTNHDRIDALKKQGSLSTRELAEYNALLADTARLEKNRADEVERRSKLEAVLKDRPSNAEADQAANIGELLQGDAAAKAIAGVEQGMRSASNASKGEGQLGQLRAQLRTYLKRAAEFREKNPTFGGGQTPEEKDAESIQKRITAQEEGIRKQAEDLVTKAAKDGDAKALDAVIGYMPKGDLRDQLAINTPAAIRASDEAAQKFDDDQAAYSQRAKRRRAAAAWSLDAAGFLNKARQHGVDLAKRESEAKSAILEKGGQEGEDALRKQNSDAAAADSRKFQQQQDAAAAFAAQQPRSADSYVQEAAALEMKQAAFAVDAQVEQFNGVEGPATQAMRATTQKLLEIESKLRQIQMQQSRQMGGQIGGGDYSNLPIYQGGY